MDNVNKMGKFFKWDICVKNILYNTAPKDYYGYDKDLIVKYSDSLFKALDDVDYYISSMLSTFNFYSVNDFREYIKYLKQELINCRYDFLKLCNFYNRYFAMMREEIIKYVGENCYGYNFCGRASVKMGQSINEILHIIHQSIVNNENNYKDVSIVASKKNVAGGDIVLIGKDNDVVRKIYENIPYSLMSYNATVMSVSDDKIVVMVRDYGHCLSIEIDKEDNKYFVKYFIPKICNVDMVNKLKGVKPVNVNSTYTIGSFSCDVKDLPNELVDFILKVPTDADMVFDNSRHSSFNR